MEKLTQGRVRMGPAIGCCVASTSSLVTQVEWLKLEGWDILE